MNNIQWLNGSGKQKRKQISLCSITCDIFESVNVRNLPENANCYIVSILSIVPADTDPPPLFFGPSPSGNNDCHLTTNGITGIDFSQKVENNTF